MDGKSLKKKIQELDVSQVDLAKMLNVTPQSLTAVFSAKDVRSGTIEKIAQALKKTPMFFYGDDMPETREPHVNSSVQTINKGSNNTQIFHGDSPDISLLKQRVTDLEQIIFEKERLISILLQKDK